MCALVHNYNKAPVIPHHHKASKKLTFKIYMANRVGLLSAILRYGLVQTWNGRSTYIKPKSYTTKAFSALRSELLNFAGFNRSDEVVI